MPCLGQQAVVAGRAPLRYPRMLHGRVMKRALNLPIRCASSYAQPGVHRNWCTRRRLLTGYNRVHGRAKSATGRYHRLSASGLRNREINCIETQYRKDADHAPRGGGQDGHPGAGCWSLPASPARADPALPDRRGVLFSVRCPFGRAGQGAAGLCATRV
jgi:hypothetical protein